MLPLQNFDSLVCAMFIYCWCIITHKCPQISYPEELILQRLANDTGTNRELVASAYVEVYLAGLKNL